MCKEGKGETKKAFTEEITDFYNLINANVMDVKQNKRLKRKDDEKRSHGSEKTDKSSCSSRTAFASLFIDSLLLPTSPLLHFTLNSIHSASKRNQDVSNGKICLHNKMNFRDRCKLGLSVGRVPSSTFSVYLKHLKLHKEDVNHYHLVHHSSSLSSCHDDDDDFL